MALILSDPVLDAKIQTLTGILFRWLLSLHLGEGTRDDQHIHCAYAEAFQLEGGPDW